MNNYEYEIKKYKSENNKILSKNAELKDFEVK